MGAETTYYCQVLVSKKEWIEVQAVTMDEAIETAEKQRGVIKCIEVRHDRPEEANDRL